MSAGLTIDSSGIEDYERFLELFPQTAQKALSMSINDTMRDVVLPEGRRMMEEQVNYPAGYLDDNRFAVKQFATPTQLVGQVAGRGRATSLARFATAGQGVPGRKWTPVDTVEVRPGNPRPGNRMYLIPLRAGTTMGGNIGLAIRLRKGEKLQNIREFQPIEIYPDTYILYGPSVDQIFQSIAMDLEPKIVAALKDEFYRQFYRLNSNA